MASTTISRTWYNTLVDDSGGGTDGTIIDKADFDAILDAIDGILATDVEFGASVTANGAVAAIGGTVTGSTPVLEGSQTWNNGAVSFDGILLNVTDTASAAAARLLELKVGGSSKFRVTKDGAVYERGRTSPIGEWTAPAFNAANFSGFGTMTWTVASGDVGAYAYSLIGKSMIVLIFLSSTTVAGTPTSQLMVAIPGGFTAAKAASEMCQIIDNGSRTTGLLQVAAAGTTVDISRLDAANFTASTDNTFVRGTIIFEVQ
jgi:hypothetical protein